MTTPSIRREREAPLLHRITPITPNMRALSLTICLASGTSWMAARSPTRNAGRRSSASPRHRSREWVTTADARAPAATTRLGRSRPRHQRLPYLLTRIRRPQEVTARGETHSGVRDRDRDHGTHSTSMTVSRQLRGYPDLAHIDDLGEHPAHAPACSADARRRRPFVRCPPRALLPKCNVCAAT